MSKHSQDRKLVASLQDHEIDTIAHKFGVHRHEVREFLEKMKGDGKPSRSREEVEKELRLQGNIPVDERIPPDTEAPDLPDGDVYVTK